MFFINWIGFENLDSGVGVYAPDAESYTLFKPLFDPIIEDYHGGFKSTDKHPKSDWGDINTLVDLDPEGKYVVSTRVRCGRSLKGYPFNPCLTEAVSCLKKISLLIVFFDNSHQFNSIQFTCINSFFIRFLSFDFT